MKVKTQRQSLNKQRLIRRIGQQTRLSNAQVTEAVESLVAIMMAELGSGGRIEIANFLVLETQTRTRLLTRHRATTDEPLISPIADTYCTLKCRPGKHLRARLHELSRKLPKG